MIVKRCGGCNGSGIAVYIATASENHPHPVDFHICPPEVGSSRPPIGFGGANPGGAWMWADERICRPCGGLGFEIVADQPAEG